VRQALGVLAFLLAFPALVRAHDLEFTYAVVVLGSNRTFIADVTCDLDAIALGVAQGADSEDVVRELKKLSAREMEERIERVREVLMESVRFRIDGEVRTRTFSLLFPEHGHLEEMPVPTILGLTASFRGEVPAGARTFTLAVDRAFPPVYLTVMDERAQTVGHVVLNRGEESDPFPISGSSERDSPSRIATAWRYFRLGLWHIVPEGLDHILFVLGLFLLSPRPRALLLQVTAFTVAHTATLALSSYGVLRLPPEVVEPLIALSIAYVAVENVLTTELKPWRPLVVFLFGLLHGMGFAGVLGDLGIPRDEFLTALLSFNLGVEAGQLTVLAGAFLSIGWFRGRSWYRRAVTVPLSIGIAMVGLYWAVIRVI
jgi:hypothetical protein